MNKLSNILLSISALLVLGTILLVLLADRKTEESPFHIVSVNVIPGTVTLDEITQNENIRYYDNSENKLSDNNP